MQAQGKEKNVMEWYESRGNAWVESNHVCNEQGKKALSKVRDKEEEKMEQQLGSTSYGCIFEAMLRGGWISKNPGELVGVT